jgi:hypothetical protein
MNRFIPLARMLFVATATVLVWGSGVSHAERVFSAADRLHPDAIRDQKVDRNLSPAARARLQRAAAIKKKKDTQKFIQELVQADQPAASPKTGKGGAK